MPTDLRTFTTLSVFLRSRLCLPAQDVIPFTAAIICRARSIIFEPAHPSGPLGGLHAPRLGPRPIRVEVLGPFQFPQFFQADLPDGPIQEEAVHTSIVPLDTERPEEINVKLRAQRWPEVSTVRPPQGLPESRRTGIFALPLSEKMSGAGRVPLVRKRGSQPLSVAHRNLLIP